MWNTLKFMNSCMANNDTYEEAQICFTPNSDRGHNYSFGIDLANSLLALHANSCLIWIDRRISDSLKYIQKHMAHKQLKTH